MVWPDLGKPSPIHVQYARAVKYRFVLAGAFFGPDSEDEMSALVRSQFLAMLADSGERATSMREWCELSATELEQSPDLCGVEVWDVFEGDAVEARLTLLYYPDADSGLLFHAGTAKPTGVALWPEGFKPKAAGGGVTDVDLEALSDAFGAR